MKVVRKELAVGEVVKGLLHIGCDIWIKKESMQEAERMKDPSKFIITLANSIWEPEQLSMRTTRLKLGVEKVLFTPKKLECIVQQYSKWLSKNGYKENALSTELRNVNRFMNRAADGARRKLVLSKKRTVNPAEENQDVGEKDDEERVPEDK